MQRISVHIPDETRQQIDLAARTNGKIEAEVIREALERGLKIIRPKSSSAQALVNLAKMAEGLPSDPKDPTDISEDTAKYAFGEPK